jgi:hypothetical protein
MVYLVPAVLVLASGGNRAWAQFSTGLYVATDGPSGGVYRITGSGANQVTTPVVSSGLSTPYGLGFSPDGTLLYVADSAANAVKVFNSSGNLVTGGTISLATDSSKNALPGAPTGLAVDSSGNVYVSLNGSNGVNPAVVEIQANASGYINSNSTIVDYASGLRNPSGLAIGPVISNTSQNNLYIGQYGINGETSGLPKLYTAPVSGQAPSGGFGASPVSGSNFNSSVVNTIPGMVNDSNYMYYSYQSYNSLLNKDTSGGVEKISLGTGAVSPVLTTSSVAPFSLALDPSGTLYFDTVTNGTIYQITSPGSNPSQSPYSSALASLSPSYMVYHADPGGTGTPEPGCLALGVVVTLAGVIGWAVNRRRAEEDRA